MKQTASIAASITSLWRDDSTLSGSSYTPLPNSGIVPGGLLYGIGKAPKAAPYATMSVKLDGDPDYNSGVFYAQRYRLKIDVWGNSQLTNAGAIQAALESLLTATTKLNQLTDNAWTLYIGLKPASIEEEAERATAAGGGAGNVFVAGGTWQIRLQEVRA